MNHKPHIQPPREASIPRSMNSNPSQEERQAMRKQMFQSWTRGQRGISGLETAIILIAFTVVGSVFAYTLVSSGLFSSEKSKEAIASGVLTAVGAMELNGAVVAKDNDTDGDVDKVEFNLASVLGQETSIDLATSTDTDSDGLLSDEAVKIHTAIISYFDRDTTVADIAWTKSGLGKDDGDAILEAGEKFHIVVDLTGLQTDTLVAYDTFTIEIKPATGAPVVFQKTIPAVTSKVMVLN